MYPQLRRIRLPFDCAQGWLNLLGIAKVSAKSKINAYYNPLNPKTVLVRLFSSVNLIIQSKEDRWATFRPFDD